MNQKNYSKLILKISNLIIILSIILVVVGIFIRMKDEGSKSFQQKEVTVSVTPSLEPKPTDLDKKIDFNGPLVCQHQTKESSISALIKDKKVLGKIEDSKKTVNFLVDDDCVYFWENYSGEKICGIGVYKNLLTQLEVFNLKDVFKFLPSGLNNIKGEKSDLDLNQLLKSCQKKEIEKEIDFKPPTNVLFKNKTQ